MLLVMAAVLGNGVHLRQIREPLRSEVCAEGLAEPSVSDLRDARRILLYQWASPDVVGEPRAYQVLTDSLGSGAGKALLWIMLTDTSSEIFDPLSPDSDDVAERAGVSYAALGYSVVPVAHFLLSYDDPQCWRGARAAFYALAKADSFTHVGPARTQFVRRLAETTSRQVTIPEDQKRLLRSVIRLLDREAPNNTDAQSLLVSPVIRDAAKRVE